MPIIMIRTAESAAIRTIKKLYAEIIAAEPTIVMSEDRIIIICQFRLQSESSVFSASFI